MFVYLVFKLGLRMAECGGVFTDEAVAKVHAAALKDAEPDDYHSFAVAPLELDVPYALGYGEVDAFSPKALPIPDAPLLHEHVMFKGTLRAKSGTTCWRTQRQ